LVALNTLSFLFTTALVFVYTRQYSTAPVTPWLAAVAFSLGAFAIEYALGVWPHGLSVALVFSAVFLAGRSIENGAVRAAAAAGFLLGLSAGVRYQNAVVLAAVGAGIFLLGRRRMVPAIMFAVCAAVPLTASSAINHARLGSWNPISKGPGYLTVPAVDQPGASLTDPFVLFWAQVVDYSVRPPLADPTAQAWLSYEPVSGAHLILRLVQKKSLLQSAPWIVISLFMWAAAWKLGRSGNDACRRQLRLMCVAVGAILAVFSFAGLTRHDGLTFNQRYLLEIVPCAAVAFAWALDSRGLRFDQLVPGAILGAAVVLLLLVATPLEPGADTVLWSLRHVALSRVPLIIAVLLAVSWLAARSRLAAWLPLGSMVGLALAWGLTLHLADDVVGSHLLRRHNRDRGHLFSRLLPDRSALVVYWANRDAAVPLLFDRDIVILDAGADDGADAPVLVRELLAQGRRVFLLPNGFPRYVVDRIRRGFVSEAIGGDEIEILELRAGGP
jgi:hypothetical protein